MSDLIASVKAKQREDLELAAKFLDLFNPNRTRYGALKFLNETDERGKRDRKQLSVKETLTAEIVLRHLKSAEHTVGFYPHYDDTHVGFGAIDVDVYDDPELISDLIMKCADSPFIPARTISGGLHLYVLPSGKCDGKSMRAYLEAECRDRFGLPDKTEIFPKQDKIKPDKLGNYVNAPLAGILSGDLDRCFFNVDGSPILTLAESLQ